MLFSNMSINNREGEIKKLKGNFLENGICHDFYKICTIT